MKTNTPFLIMQHGGSGGMAEKFPPLPPFRHMLFLYFMYGFYGFPFSEGIPNPYRRSAWIRAESMLLFYFPLNCFSKINKKNNTLFLEQIALKDLAPLSLPYFLAASKSFLRNAIFISCVLIHLPPSS